MLEVRVRELTPASPQVQAIAQQIISLQAELATPQPQDAPLIGLLALNLAIARMAGADLLQHGYEGPGGKERPAVKVFGEASRRAAELCDRLGIGPLARSKLGLGGARSLDDLLAEALRQPAPQPARAVDSPGAGEADAEPRKQCEHSQCLPREPDAPEPESPAA